ncbi:hypothetical protein EYZ11_004085 [Aspergillus tanneri]|uniref:Enoyl reductase (ER) domain-containing protein n=1 Tax=Aspergillus tanneri TaxID=1220188 RepID=A0A4S3JLI2_9EURO|nr:uncharacterized protein ATNIH1004_006032 [Aspergillus tanneri]KAA8647340.1 hypothetical protein ATNIH1004_006032 [Aspergillus tanneri]THC96436.1 hypothetical protein EYZ11_004085 [Aspergillus tanneri]
MQAVRLHPSPRPSTPYSPTNPAPPSVLKLDHNLPIPLVSKPDEILIRVKASTIIRDTLTWPETYIHEYAIPGNDFSGVVVAVSDTSDSSFKPGDELFGMAHVDRSSTWAEYVLVRTNEVALKPASLSWEEAASVPLSAQTAYEALFVHAGVSVLVPDNNNNSNTRTSNPQTVLITGAAGGVGIYLVQLARLAGLHVVVATSSNTRNAEFLRDLGAHETVEYDEVLQTQSTPFDIIIDTVGGNILDRCWDLVVPVTGCLISVDSASANFVQEHEKKGLSRSGIKALAFIVQGSSESLQALARFVDTGALRVFVHSSYPLSQVVEAYERAHERGGSSRGKVVLTV